MQEERKRSRNLLSEEQIMNLTDGVPTKRRSMQVESRANAILQEIINLKTKAKILPITMRKLYSYKIIEINTKQKEDKKVIPLVLRKRNLIERTAFS
jgi:hypothetical protein